MNSALTRITLVFSVLLMLAVSASGQVQGIRADLQNFNFDFAGQGARAEGMGKAYFAVSDDVYAGGWNPAGLFVHDGPMFGITWGSLSPRGKTTTSFFNVSNEFDHQINGKFSGISSLNLVAPVRIKGHKFVGSLNFTRNYDEFDFMAQSISQPIPDSTFSELAGSNGQNPNDWMHTVNGIPGHRLLEYVEDSHGGFDTWNFAFGTRLYKKFSMGLSINIMAGRVIHSINARDSLSNVVSAISFNQAADHVIGLNVIDSIRFSGVNFNLGLKYNGEKTSAALMIRTPQNINAAAVSTAYTSIEKNGLPFAENVVLTPNIDPPLIKYNVPLIFGGGVSRKVGENSLVALDVEYRRFSATEFKIRDSVLVNAAGNNTEWFTEVSADEEVFRMWQDGIAIRLGGEHIKETGFGTVPIRAGFGYVTVPSGSIDFSEEGDVIIDANGAERTLPGVESSVAYNFSGGTGIHWEQIHLDIAYTFTTRSKEVTLPLNLAQNLYSTRDFDFKNHHVSISFTGYF